METQEALKTRCSQGLLGTGMASKKPGDVTMCRDGGFLPQKEKEREGGTSEKAIRNLSKNMMCSTMGSTYEVSHVWWACGMKGESEPHSGTVPWGGTKVIPPLKPLRRE